MSQLIPLDFWFYRSSDKTKTILNDTLQVPIIKGITICGKQYQYCCKCHSLLLYEHAETSSPPENETCPVCQHCQTD